MMRFKVGDRVTIRHDVCFFKQADGILISNAMTKEAGRTGRVTGVIDGFGYKLDCSKYWWPYCALLEPDIASQLIR